MIKPLWLRIKTNAYDKLNWLSLLSGLSLVLAYAPFSLWWLPFIALPFWFSFLKQLDIRTATKQGFIFAFGWFASGLSWVHVSIDQFGGMPLIASILLMVLLVAYLALYPAFACYLSARFSNNRKLALGLLPLFWFITDIFRGVFLTGFPWLSLGYSQIDGPLSSLAPVIGEQGISLVIIFASVALVTIIGAFKKQQKVSILAPVFLAILALSNYLLHQIDWVTNKERVVSVALVQGNIAQAVKWQPAQEWPNAMKYLELTQKNFDADIVIWPESAITGLEPMQWVQEFLSLADQAAAINSSAIITGILNYDVDTKEYFNGLIVLGNYHSKATNSEEKSNALLVNHGDYSYGNSNRYYKNHLLPIGEFVPFQEWLAPLAPLFNLPMSSFSRGEYVQENIKANGIQLLPLICFEIAFPEQLAANLTDKTDAIITVSNDAWFGNSHGPDQHLDIARMRALEFGRPVLRATNTGITATIDHLGNITHKIPQFEQEVLRANMTLVDGSTPYSRWYYLLPWLVICLYSPYLLWQYFIQKLATVGK